MSDAVMITLIVVIGVVLVVALAVMNDRKNR